MVCHLSCLCIIKVPNAEMPHFGLNESPVTKKMSYGSELLLLNKYTQIVEASCPWFTWLIRHVENTVEPNSLFVSTVEIWLTSTVLLHLWSDRHSVPLEGEVDIMGIEIVEKWPFRLRTSFSPAGRQWISNSVDRDPRTRSLCPDSPSSNSSSRDQFQSDSLRLR